MKAHLIFLLLVGLVTAAFYRVTELIAEGSNLTWSWFVYCLAIVVTYIVFRVCNSENNIDEGSHKKS